MGAVCSTQQGRADPGTAVGQKRLLIYTARVEYRSESFDISKYRTFDV